jgi:hypothetical protein
MGKDLDGRVSGLNDVISQNLREGTEEIHRKPQSAYQESWL